MHLYFMNNNKQNYWAIYNLFYKRKASFKITILRRTNTDITTLSDYYTVLEEPILGTV